MKKIATISLSIVLSLFCINHTFSQEKILFQDTFSDNTNQWAITNHEKAYLNIENGRYVFEHKRAESVWATWGTQPIDQSKDFKIHVVLRYIRGGEGHGFGVYWGSKDLENYFTFNFSKHGHVRFGKVELNKWYDRIPWTLSEAVRADNQINTMTIVKRGNQYYFYANDVLLESSYYEPLQRI